jgi:hypothetical protein
MARWRLTSTALFVDSPQLQPSVTPAMDRGLVTAKVKRRVALFVDDDIGLESTLTQAHWNVPVGAAKNARGGQGHSAVVRLLKAHNVISVAETQRTIVEAGLAGSLRPA